MKLLNPFKRRDMIAVALFALAFIILLFKLLLLSQKKESTATPINIPTIERGSIYDRNGRLLAQQIQTFNISLWLPDLREVREDESAEQYHQRLLKTAELLGSVALFPVDDLLAKMTDRNVSHVDLFKRAQVDQKDALLTIAKANDIRGLRITSEYSRFYPNGALASNLIGYVNNDNHGGEGIEYSFEKIIAPPLLGSNKDISDGKSIELTIDANLQGIIESKVKQAFLQQKAASAVAIVMEAKTGAILSYVNLPTYDNNFYNQSTWEERMNRPVTDAFEPGSVFKVFTISALLDAGLIKSDDQFFCDGAYETVTNLGERIVIKCQGHHGWQTPAQILANSCNTGTALASEKATNQEFYKYLQAYGFGKKTGIPLAGETAGLLAPPSKWSARSKPTLAIGQEVAVSTMQLLQAATVITNSGQMIKPQLVKRILNSDGSTFKDFKREVIGDVIKPQTATNMLKMLELGVTSGIARRMHVNGLSIAAKTGTSQTYDANTGTYSEENYIASSLAIFPAEKPEYIVYVAFHRPMGSSYFGASIVAPLIKELIEDIIPYAGLQLGTSEVHFAPQHIVLNNKKAEENSFLPDLSGLDGSEAIGKLRQAGVNVKVEGDVHQAVESQFPPPGTLMQNEMTVVLYMKTS